MMDNEKPFAPACERNQEPIRAVLAGILTEPARVLEIGSGTGQHAVYLCRHMPWLRWQPTDIPEAVPGIRRWVEDGGLDNLAMPMALDVGAGDAVPDRSHDAIFSANTLHYISWPLGLDMLTLAARVLSPGGEFLLYGPFNENDSFTSEGNEALDAWLKSRDPESGIRDRQRVVAAAEALGLVYRSCYDMPANNRILHFQQQDA